MSQSLTWSPLLHPHPRPGTVQRHVRADRRAALPVRSAHCRPAGPALRGEARCQTARPGRDPDGQARPHHRRVGRGVGHDARPRACVAAEWKMPWPPSLHGSRKSCGSSWSPAASPSEQEFRLMSILYEKEDPVVAPNQDRLPSLVSKRSISIFSVMTMW